MKSLLWLSRLAAAVWLAWIGFLALLILILLLRVAHPHFLPITLVLAAMIVSGVLLVVAGAVDIVRRPQRMHSLRAVLIGTAPLWFLAAHIMYGFKAGHSRQVNLDFFQKMLIPFGESAVDLAARFQYPQRVEGEKVVMISTPQPDAAATVQRMDAHVRDLEQRLGRPIGSRIHWIRGSVLGMQGRALYGLCMGSIPELSLRDKTGLDPLDRHEVAHCVINAFCTIASEPPSLLSEGFAEAHMGRDEHTVAYNAWKFRNEGGALPLSELTGPEWLGRHEWPVYVQGSALVNYLLRRFGAERFLELYTTCRRSHFADDCRRILGVGLDELETGYWADIDSRVADTMSRARGRLEEIELAPDIDRAEWHAFLKEYFAAVPKLLAPYENASMTIEMEVTAAPGRTDAPGSSARYRLVRSGDCSFLHVVDGNSELAAIANPRNSLVCRRANAGEPWKPEPRTTRDPQRLYRQALHLTNTSVRQNEAVAVLATDTARGQDLAECRLTGIARDADGDGQIVKVHFETKPTGSPAAWMPWNRVTFSFAMNECCALRSFHYEAPADTVLGEQQYDWHEGVPVVRRRLTTFSDPQGPRATAELRVTECRFEPTADAEFTPETLLHSPIAELAAGPIAEYNPPRQVWDWYPVPVLLGAVWLAGGCFTTRLTSRVRAQPV
ncbi:MAG: hypothetical protein EXS05_16265 [Planctomycetaceae bacterium]|nr:hypothetical protein [Planctomycetaceae bacterium]